MFYNSLNGDDSVKSKYLITVLFVVVGEDDQNDPLGLSRIP